MWYIIRHGETSHNVKKIRQGHYPSVLNSKGIEQSKAIAKKIKELEKDFKGFKFLTSPMLRSRQTIQIIMHILGVKQKEKVEELLKNRGKGIFENLPKTFPAENFPEEIEKKNKDLWNYAPPGGESRKDVYERILKFLEKYKDKKDLVIVLHGGNGKILRGLLEGKTEKELKKLKASHKQNCFYTWDDKKIKLIKV